MSDGGNGHFEMVDLFERQAAILRKDAADLLRYNEFLTRAGQQALQARAQLMLKRAGQLSEGAGSVAMTA